MFSSSQATILARKFEHLLRRSRSGKSCPPCRVTACYLVFGLVWIVVSEVVVGSQFFFTTDPHVLQTVEEILLVLASSGVIFFLLQLETNHIRRISRELEKSNVQLRHLLTSVDRGAQLEYENALRRSARALSALGMVSREIAAATDQKTLLAHVCRLLVDEGSYKMAWIACPKQDQVVTVLTGFGDTDTYLPVGMIGWEDLVRVHSPVSQSIQTGRVVRVSVEDEEPSLAVWRIEAKRVKVGGCVAVPIPYISSVKSADLYCVLALYTRSGDEFDEREARILETLGRDLGHALSALREAGETASLNQLVSERVEYRLHDVIAQTVMALTTTLETRDPYTAGHEERVARFALAIAQRMGMDDDFKCGLHISGLLHDIGKIGIPAEILSKPGRLTTAEMDLVCQHPRIGYDIIKHVDFPWPVARVVYEHHERMDGSGYPRHLKEEDICLESRIIAVADVIEAITSHRPYRPARSVADAVAAISEPGKFDPRVCAAAIELINEGLLSVKKPA